jgi:hypothetical protein
MFRSPFTRFMHPGSGFRGRAARRAVVRAASLGAVTLLMLGTLPGAAVAQSTAKPLEVYLWKVHCVQESDDGLLSFADEPYVVIFAADLRGGTAQASVRLFWYFDGMSTGDTLDGRLRFWSPDGTTASPIGSDDDYIFLVALMESDDGYGANMTRVKTTMTNSMIPRLKSYKQSGLSRASMASLLRADMDLAIEAARDNDDRIGGIYEVLWGPNGLKAAQAGYPVELIPRFQGSDSSIYTLTFWLQ